jgi:hypothetical protein
VKNRDLKMDTGRTDNCGKLRETPPPVKRKLREKR